MSDTHVEIDVAAWVDKAKADPVTFRQRQAIEITLNAIASTHPLNEELYLKGGILMGLAYGSPRQTADIDLTAGLNPDMTVDARIEALLNSAFPSVAARLGYTDLILKVHSIKKQPKKIFETAEAPALKIKIAFAVRGTDEEKTLNDGKVPRLIEVDISFNEIMNYFQILELTGGAELRAYSLSELIAEKLRSVLQQKERDRNRRQDIDRLVAEHAPDEKLRAEILKTFVEKSRSRNIEPTINSFDDEETRARSRHDWDTLKLEIGTLPEFEDAYERVRGFYKSLPWS
ncbi:hypothetical protein MMA231_04001 (plasmid) [Asticcacaulis sp. MM231]|uniref:nucleotidyl transferase AbiEii/AbiGii toxin family protein n=1 Tax=Asticcacaulis sp. MM231 TaxID=3157666 RepID=UPI0032D58A71